MVWDLRGWGFVQNEASLAVLPDLLVELDSMDEVCLTNNPLNLACWDWEESILFFHVMYYDWFI